MAFVWLEVEQVKQITDMKGVGKESSMCVGRVMGKGHGGERRVGRRGPCFFILVKLFISAHILMYSTCVCISMVLSCPVGPSSFPDIYAFLVFKNTTKPYIYV